MSGKDAGKAASKSAQAAKKKVLPGQKKGVKPKKKSWTKTKVKDKLNNAVFLEPKQYERMSKDLQKTLMITIGIVMDKYKVCGAIARALIRDLASKKIINPVGEQHSKFLLYSGKDAKSALEQKAAKAETEAAAAEKKAKGKKGK